MVCFLYNFHKAEDTLLSFSDLEEIMAHQTSHRAGTGKNTNGAPSAPVDGKGLRKAISQ
jgi:hypothetical protein